MKLVVFILFTLIELIISEDNNLYPKLETRVPTCGTCGNYCFKYCNGHSYACGQNNVCRVYKIIKNLDIINFKFGFLIKYYYLKGL